MHSAYGLCAVISINQIDSLCRDGTDRLWHAIVQQKSIQGIFLEGCMDGSAIGMAMYRQNKLYEEYTK